MMKYPTEIQRATNEKPFVPLVVTSFSPTQWMVTKSTSMGFPFTEYSRHRWYWQELRRLQYCASFSERLEMFVRINPGY